MTATLSALFSMSQSLSDGAEAGVSLREFGPLLVCPKPLFGSSAVDSASGSCCGAVATNRTQVRKYVTSLKMSVVMWLAIMQARKGLVMVNSCYEERKQKKPQNNSPCLCEHLLQHA